MDFKGNTQVQKYLSSVVVDAHALGECPDTSGLRLSCENALALIQESDFTSQEVDTGTIFSNP
jgi:hypothetical protein